MKTRFTELVGCRAPLQLAGMGEVGMPELAAARSRVIEIFWREPDAALVGRIHDAGALAGWQVGSLGEARAAAEAGCDIVVAQGVEAGGHVRGTIPLLALLDAVVGTIGESTVVVASGGIGSGRSVAAALAAGADSVRVGTRFVASAESRARLEYKRALVDAAAGETVLSDEYGRETGWPDAPNRVLRRAFDRATATSEPMVGRMRLPGRDDPVPIPRFSPLPPTDTCGGEITTMALYAGESVGAVREVLPAAEIVRELLEGAEIALRSALRR